MKSQLPKLSETGLQATVINMFNKMVAGKRISTEMEFSN